MQWDEKRQGRSRSGWKRPRALGGELITPNPKLKLVMRLKHYSIRTERCYCDWIKRYIHFHRMQAREDLNGGEAKIELHSATWPSKGRWPPPRKTRPSMHCSSSTTRSCTRLWTASRQCEPTGRSACRRS